MVQRVKINSSNERYNNANDEARAYDIEANVRISGGVANNFDSGKVFKNEVCIASFNWWNPNNLSITCENIGLNEQVSVLEAVNVFISDVKESVSE